MTRSKIKPCSSAKNWCYPDQCFNRYFLGCWHRNVIAKGGGCMVLQATRLPAAGNRTPHSHKHPIDEKTVSQIWLTLMPTWKKILPKPTVSVHTVLGKRPLLNFLIALHPCKLLFDWCLHSPSLMLAIISWACSLHPCYRAGNNLGCFCKNL